MSKFHYRGGPDHTLSETRLSDKFGSGSSSGMWNGHKAAMPCGWEGNRRSGVALAMRHGLQWFIQLRAHGLRKGDEHPANTPHGVRHNLFI